MLNVYNFLKSQGDEYKKLSFRDVLFVHYQCPQTEQFAHLYTHNSYILYAISGKKTYHMPGKSIPVQGGSCAFIKKGGYKQESFLKSDWIVLVFFMPDNFLRKFINEYRTILTCKINPNEVLEVFTQLHITSITKSFFEGIIPYFIQKPAPPESIIELKFRELLLNIISDPANKSLLNYLINLADCDKPLLHEVMEQNFMYNLSLNQFARIAQRSLSAFKREFTNIYKMPPGQWLMAKRLQYASLLLRTTLWPVTEVAADSGFENVSHFNRVFKQTFKTSPLQYRSGHTGEYEMTAPKDGSLIFKPV